jgi:hypothetical protein
MRSGPSRRGVLRRILALTAVTLMVSSVMLGISGSAAEASPPFQGDCGWVTCTIRLDRAQTRNARDAGAVIGIAAGACGAASAGTLALVCGAAVAPAAGIIAVAAARFYEQGDCLQFKFLKYPPAGVVQLAVPGSVKRGTRNCS